MRALSILLVLLASVGCSSSASDDGNPDETGDTQDKLLAGRKLSETEVASVLRGAGFEEDVVAPMVCTAKYESSFYEKASHKNADGSVDRGLFQVNSTHLGASGCPRTADGLYDAKTNARCAHVVWSEQGIRAWYGYQKHRTECDSYQIADE